MKRTTTLTAVMTAVFLLMSTVKGRGEQWKDSAYNASIHRIGEQCEQYTSPTDLEHLAKKKKDATAQFCLGWNHLLGKKFPKDHKEAFSWLCIAAEQGYAPAHTALGLMYHYGKGVKKNYTQASKHYSLAAKQGYAPAQKNLGIMNKGEKEVARDCAEAVELCRPAAMEKENKLSAVSTLKSVLLTGDQHGEKENQSLSTKDRRKAIEEGLSDIAFGEAEAAKDLLRAYSIPESGWPFEHYLNLGLVLSGTDFNKKDKNTLDIDYDSKQSWYKEISEEKKGKFSGIKADFTVEGRKLFQAGEDSEDSNDFLKAALNVGYFNSRGGVIDTTGCEFYEAAEEVKNDLKTIGELDMFLASDNWHELNDIIRSQLTDQYYLDVVLNVGLETDHRIETRQIVLGPDLGFTVRGWAEENSLIGKLNIFDYPRAFIMMLRGKGWKWSPRGVGVPTVKLGLKHVWPQGGDDSRAKVDESNFWRYDIEIISRNPVAKRGGKHIFLEHKLLRYGEINPSDEVKQEDSAKYTYFSTKLEFPNGLFIEYTWGRRPPEEKKDHTYRVGLNYKQSFL